MDMATRILDLSQCYHSLNAVFPYFQRLDFDPEAWYSECIRRAVTAQDEKHYHLAMIAFLNRFGDGHTDYRPPRAWMDRIGYLPFRLDTFSDGYYRAGERVLAIDGVAPEAWAERMRDILPSREGFLYPETFQLYLPLFLSENEHILTTKAGETVFRLFPERAKPTGFRPEASLSYATLCERPCLRHYSGDILYIRLDHFLTDWAQPIREALTAGRRWRGVILDIRENIGGMTVYAARVAELFLNGEFSACRKWTRLTRGIDLASASQLVTMTAEELKKLGADKENRQCLDTLSRRNFEEYTDNFGRAGQKAVFSGPLVLLTGSGTISAAEDFTAMFRSNGRAWLLGMPTRGTTGTPLMQTLPGGGALRVVSVGYRLLDGTEFIGKGIACDEQCPPNPNAWYSGSDEALQRALEHLLKSKSPGN